MCELFGMSSREPAAVTYSLREFARHGGGTAHHRDGWGIAYHEGREARLIRDIDSAADSPYVRFMADRGYQSAIVMAHIRHATQGVVALRNTQPFERELGGRRHLFAHNGDLQGVEALGTSESRCHRPIGETDSEQAFCVLLQRLLPWWRDAPDPPALEQRVAAVTELAADLRRTGPANFLYSDGEVLIAHGHRRMPEPDAEAATSPGLHMLVRHCTSDGAPYAPEGITIAGRPQWVVLFASVPLTDEPWEPLAEGEIVVARAGEIVDRIRPSRPEEDRRLPNL